MANRVIVLELDELDYDAVQSAMARRQSVLRLPDGANLPDGSSNLAGALIAEICRGWLELREWYGAR